MTECSGGLKLRREGTQTVTQLRDATNNHDRAHLMFYRSQTSFLKCGCIPFFFSTSTMNVKLMLFKVWSNFEGNNNHLPFDFQHWLCILIPHWLEQWTDHSANGNACIRQHHYRHCCQGAALCSFLESVLTCLLSPAMKPLSVTPNQPVKTEPVSEALQPIWETKQTNDSFMAVASLQVQKKEHVSRQKDLATASDTILHTLRLK